MRTLLMGRSLRTILIGLFVPLMVVNGGLTGFLAFRTGQSAVTDLAHQLQNETTARIQDHLQAYLTWPHQINQLNLDAIALGQINPDEFATLEPYFWKQVQRFDIGSVAYASERGEYLNLGRQDPQGPIMVAVTEGETTPAMQIYATDIQGRRTQITQIYPNYDPRTRPWYQQAVAAQQPSWTPIFVWTSGAVGIDAVVPIYDEGQRLRGVLDVSLTLEEISRFLQGLTVGTTGMTYIIDRDGLIVASSASEPPSINDRTAPARRSVLDSQVPMIRGSAQALLRDHGGFAAIQDQQTVTFDLDTGPALAHATPYRDSYGLDWLIIVVVPEADFMGRITANTRTTTALVVLSLVIVCGIASGIAARITRPIQALNQAATAFAAGQWDQTIPQGCGREVNELAAAFRSMAAQLCTTFASLQTKEQRLREALEAAQMGTWEWNIPQRRATWSDQVGPLYGLPPGEQRGSPEALLAMIHPEDRQVLSDQISACLTQHRTSFAVEHRTRWPDGSLHWLEATGQIWHDGRQQPLHLRGTVTEITARKAADAALRESQERYRIISELVSSYAYAYRCDPDGSLALEWITDAFTPITGHDSACLGTLASWDALICPADRARVQHHRAQILAGAPPDMVEYVISAGDGRPLWLREYHRPVWDRAASRIERLYGAAQDITRFKQLEQQLQQAQKMEAIGRLAGGIAHDFNNLLTVILGHCALAQLDLAPASPLGTDIAVIQDAADRAAMLTHQLLAFSRQQVLQPQVVGLNAIVTSMGQLLQRLIGEDITLVLRLDPTVGTVVADPGQLQQVIMNLALNARDAMPAGGTLTIETSELWRDGLRWAQLGVHDTGSGMDPSTQAHIFEPFFTTKAIGKGTGLGLATVHGIVLQSHGQIEVTSTIGHGTTFRIALPSVSGEQAHSADSAPQGLPPGAGTILLVEDEDPVRALIARVLRTHGYHVIEARSGVHALEVIAQTAQAIDLLLTDMIMPGGLSGQHLAAHLQAQMPGLKVLYISGYTDTMPLQEAPDSTCAWLHKPFTPEAVVRTVGSILQQR